MSTHPLGGAELTGVARFLELRQELEFRDINQIAVNKPFKTFPGKKLLFSFRLQQLDDGIYIQVGFGIFAHPEKTFQWDGVNGHVVLVGQVLAETVQQWRTRFRAMPA